MKALEIRNWLKTQKEIKYVEVDRQSYSKLAEKKVMDILKRTHVFIQPYQTLDSTLDTPLLLLEAMASLCAVITTPVGNIPEIYGPSEFIVARKGFLSAVLDLFKDLSLGALRRERERIYERNTVLKNIRSNEVIGRFLNALP